jgi:hypothetical protein
MNMKFGVGNNSEDLGNNSEDLGLLDVPSFPAGIWIFWSVFCLLTDFTGV